MAFRLKSWRGRVTVWRLLTAVILVAAAVATYVRFAHGLGASTNLNDGFPWGLWIGFDLLVGVGLAAGGFVIAATVHIFRIEGYAPIARPTILTAFLGYLLVIVALLFDLGQPWRIWHPLVMWNPHSVMFEVGWCVTLYTTVLALEFSPLVFERLAMERPLRIIRSIYVPLVIAGVLLSTLHQSSLGTLYVIAPDKLHGLWYTPLLPVFFFLTAIAGGLAMVIFESFMSSRAFGKQLEPHLLRGIGRVIVVLLAVYVVWKFQDLALRGHLARVFEVTTESVMFWGEIGLGALLPMALFSSRRVRHNEGMLFFAAMLTVIGFVISRLNVAITGMSGSATTSYVPSWMEFAISIGIVAAGFVLFGLAVKHLPVFPEPAEPPVRRFVPARPRPALGRGALVSLWSLMAVGALLLGYTTFGGRGTQARPLPSAEAPELAPAPMIWEEYVFPRGEDSPGPVAFRHESHVDDSQPDCATCHRDRYRISEPGALQEGQWTFERVHEGDLCAACHDGATAFAVDDECSNCHSM